MQNVETPNNNEVEIFSNDLISNAVKLSQKETQDKKLKRDIKLLKESLITQYLDGAFKYANTPKLKKDGVPYSYNSLLSEYKAELHARILKEEDAETKSDIYNLLNVVLKKANPKALIKLRLMDLTTLTRFSKLTNSYLTKDKMDYTLPLNELVTSINVQYKLFSETEDQKALLNKCLKKGFKVVTQA